MCGSGETRRSRIRDTGSHDVLVLDHCIRLTIRLDGRISSGLSDRSSGAWSFERESALVFWSLDDRRWNQVKKRAHRACLGFSLPEIVKISVVSVYHKLVAVPLQPVSPFLKGKLDGKKFLFPNS